MRYLSSSFGISPPATKRHTEPELLAPTASRQELVSVCTDGAAVIVGVYHGIVPKLCCRLAAVGDSLVHTLCTAHTLENHAQSDHNRPFVRHSNAPWSSCRSLIHKKVEQRTLLCLRSGGLKTGSPWWN